MIADTAEPHRGPADAGQRSERRVFGWWVFVASLVAPLVPIVVAVVRAVDRHWVPLSDDALFAIRARDVLSYHHFPLVGLDSSASLATKTTLHHPGPLLFDLLAVPVRLFGGSAGVALGIGLINVVAVVGIAAFTVRRGGPLLGTIAMATTAVLCWTMGSEALFEPWQPFSLLLPFLFFLTLAWSIACGDLLALPIAAAVGSFVVETHLSYVVLVPTLAIWAILGLSLHVRGTRREDPSAWPTARRRVVSASVTAVVIFVVCWIQPALDQAIGHGNLTALLHNTTPQRGTVGYGDGLKIVASVVALPPWWFRPSMNQTLIPARGWQFPSTALTVASLVGLAAVVGACLWLARWRRDRLATLALGTALVGLVAGVVTAVRVPITEFGLEAHVFWWLWPLSVFLYFGGVITVARWVTPRPVRVPVLAVGSALVAAVFAGLAVPTSIQGRSPNENEAAIPTARVLNAQLGRVQHDGPILVDPLIHARFADPFGLAIIAELQRRSIRFVASDPILVGQLGSARRYTGRNARSELFLAVGDDRVNVPPGTPPVATHPGLSSSERRELSRLRDELAAYIQQGRLRVSRRGFVGLGTAGALALEHADGPTLVSSGTLFLHLLAHPDYFAIDPRWSGRFHRYEQLEYQREVYTVVLYLVRLPGATRATGATGVRPGSTPMPAHVGPTWPRGAA